MYKNQLQELAQRSCFNLPSYSCIREGPDHAPRFKATVNFNGETFESPSFCSTLRQAEHAAAEVALNALASRGPSKALTARVLDESGVYKNLLQETARRAGLKLPVYTTVRLGPTHVPIFSCTVELAGMNFAGEPARTKKQAQKNAAMSAWSALKRMVQHGSLSSTNLSSSSVETVETRRGSEEQEQVTIARLLASLKPSELKNSKQSDWQRVQYGFSPVNTELTLPTPTLYAMQSLGWEGYNFSPKVSLCQMWQQEQLLLLQNHLLKTLHVPPATPPSPHMFPYLHSILPQDSRLFVPVQQIEPLPATLAQPLYYSDHVVSDPIREKSMVTIQEIHEEKIEDSFDRSPLVMPENSGVGNLNAELKSKEPVDEDDKHKCAELETKIENFQRGDNRAGQFEWASDRSVGTSYNLLAFQVPKPSTIDFSLSSSLYPLRSSLPQRQRSSPSLAAPVMVRTVGSVPLSAEPPSLLSMRPVSSVPKPRHLTTQVPAPPRMRTGVPPYSATLQSQTMEMKAVQPRFMAPAVRIRSVVPVCSAPPPRKLSISSQELALHNQDKKDIIAPDVSTASSELGKLQI
ncbi:hypothetical protein K2173_017819 [Erythroxylum novogranatense]|uniref:DRBM domain-containing protein n=1 Tax=Erythroxylum novogranatense TaxID=1862640 RepID=A0AAV8T232_9ROSI|nr:hypothetical protein K2173_017819 [Erythroxylum novogranatense]